jgi:hypothetical protein
MVRRLTFWTATALTMFAVTAAQAAEDIFHVIPADAWGFAAVNHVAATNAKVQKLVVEVGAPATDLLGMAKKETAVKKGLDETGSAAVVAMPSKKRSDDAAPVFLIPVSDYKEFLASWGAKPTAKIVEVKIAGETVVIGNRGGYAAIAPKEYRQDLEKLLDAKRSIADECPQLLPWFNENDGVAAMTSHGIKEASKQMQKQLGSMREMLSYMGDEAQAMVTALEMYANFLQWAEKDVQIMAVAARADSEGTIRAGARVCFAKDCALAATLAKLQPGEKGPLVGMPAGPFVAAGGGVCSDSLVEGIVGLQSGLMKQSIGKLYDLDEKQADRFVKALLDLPKGTRSISMIMGPGQPGEPIMGDVLALYGVENATKYLDEYEKYLQGLNAAVKNDDASKDKKAKTFASVKRTKVSERPALETEMAIPLGAKAKEAVGSEEALQKIFGPGGKQKSLIVALDDHTVAVSFGNSGPLVLRAIAALKKPAEGLASDADLAKVAAMLPAGAQWVGYISPSGAVALAKWGVDSLVPEGVDKPNIPDFPTSPPIGAAVKAVPDQLQVEVVVPSAVLDAIGKFVGLVEGAEHPEVP